MPGWNFFASLKVLQSLFRGTISGDELQIIPVHSLIKGMVVEILSITYNWF